MQTFRQIFNQTFFQIIGKAVSSISTVLILGIISRNYGEGGTGILTLALTYLGFFTLATDFGINAYLLPRLLNNDYESHWRKLFGFRILLALFLIPLSWLIVIAWSIFSQSAEINKFSQLVLLASIASIAESAIFVSANAIFQSKLRYDLSSLSWSLGALTILGFVFNFSLTNQPLEIVIFGYIIGWFVISISSLFFAKKFIKNILPIVDFNYFKDVLKNSWPLSLTLILNVVYFRLDSFLISIFKSFSDVGIYNLAYSIFQTALVLPTFIMNSFYPLMLKKFEQGKNKFKTELIKATVLMFGLGILGMVVTFIFSDFVILILTSGKGFYGSASALRILAVAFPAFFGSSVLMWALVTIKKYKTMLLIYVIGLLVNGILNFIYIPYFSYSAAAITTVFSEYLILIIQIFILYKYFRK